MSSSSTASQAGKPAAADHEILFQNWFKSVGPRTYAAQVKKARTGNHFLVLSEGKRDEATGDVRKTSLFVFSEDFPAFFKMLHEAAVFVREHPVPDAIKKKQEQFWAKRNAETGRANKVDSQAASAQNHRPGTEPGRGSRKSGESASAGRPAGSRQAAGAGS